MKAKIKNSQERIGAPLPWFAKEKYLLAGLFIGSLMVYWPTLAPGVFFGDSGELAAAVDNMGIAHPPGYPLFLILGKIFTTLVPVGSLAMRMNLFSAVFASLTLVVLYLISRLLGQNGLVSLVSACLAGFCITFWDQAVVTEVYTMAAFLLFAMVYFLLAWHRTREVRFLLLLALTGGLGMTHHVSIAVYFPLWFCL